MQKLTKSALDALKAEAHPYDVFDSANRGFFVRVHPSGRKSFRMKYTAFGRQRAMLIGVYTQAFTLEDARRAYAVAKAKAVQGVDPQAEAEAKRAAVEADRARRMTVDDLIQRYLTEGPAANPDKRATSWDDDASRLTLHISPLLGAKVARQVTKVEIEQAHQAILEGRTARTTTRNGRTVRVRGGKAIARGAIVALQTAYAWALDRDLVDANPVRRVKKTKPVKRTKFLTVEEAKAVWKRIRAVEAASRLREDHADILRLLMLTGCRLNEIVGLRWDEVDLKIGLITLSRLRSKTGERVVRLPDEAVEILQARARVASSTYVFPASRRDDNREAPTSGIQKAWRRVRGELGHPDLNIHGLRHSFGSIAAQLTGNLFLVKGSMGHKQIASTELYAHHAADPIRAVHTAVARAIVDAPEE